MGERRSRNMLLRMTDQAGLTEPGKKAPLPSSGMLLFGTILWSVSAIIWIFLAVRMQDEAQILYGVLVILSLMLAVANFVMLRKSRKRTDA